LEVYMMYAKPQILKALALVNQAAEILRELEHECQVARRYGLAGSCDRYAADLEEIASCDHGESGLRALAEVVPLESMLDRKWVRLVLANHPEKDEAWVQVGFARAYNNLEAPRQPNDEDVVVAILESEFGVIIP
jgi:hypothetical protein